MSPFHHMHYSGSEREVDQSSAIDEKDSKITNGMIETAWRKGEFGVTQRVVLPYIVWGASVFTTNLV